MVRETKEQGTLLCELRTILADYTFRMEHIGPEMFRLRGESFQEWARKRRRVALCLELLDKAIAAFDAGRFDELLHEVAEAPERHVPLELLGPAPGPGNLARVVVADLARLQDRLARLHQEWPEQCPGEGCPCREVRP